MIIYLHGFDATSPGNHEKVMQLKSIDQDVRSVHYSTIHPKQDMSHILKEAHQHINNTDDSSPLICGVGPANIVLAHSQFSANAVSVWCRFT